MSVGGSIAAERFVGVTGGSSALAVDSSLAPTTNGDAARGDVNGDDDPVGSGVYFYRLEAGTVTTSRKMVLGR